MRLELRAVHALVAGHDRYADDTEEEPGEAHPPPPRVVADHEQDNQRDEPADRADDDDRHRVRAVRRWRAECGHAGEANGRGTSAVPACRLVSVRTCRRRHWSPSGRTG